MRLRRVVITGMGAVSPFGLGRAALIQGLLEGRSGVSAVPALDRIRGIRTRVAAVVPPFDPAMIPRKHRRAMSPMSVYAVLAAQEALDQGGVDASRLPAARTGLAIGSTSGSPRTIEEFFQDHLTDRSVERTKSTVFFQFMSHTAASNVAQALGLGGRIMASSAACCTGCQAIGFAYEAIAGGFQDFMLAGGADEYHPLTSAIFDIMNAASFGYNDRPSMTPRPFDRDRDGVVCGEGAGIVLLETPETARGRGAEILAEVLGFHTSTDLGSIAHPDPGAIEECMAGALRSAGVAPGDVDYVNAHATATDLGDAAESRAIASLCGTRAKVSSLKGNLGHTMAASGGLETIAALEMMRRQAAFPTRNLENVDPSCAAVNHVRDISPGRMDIVLKNNFALGGVNSSLVLRRFDNG